MEGLGTEDWAPGALITLASGHGRWLRKSPRKVDGMGVDLGEDGSYGFIRPYHRRIHLDTNRQGQRSDGAAKGKDREKR